MPRRITRVRVEEAHPRLAESHTLQNFHVLLLISSPLPHPAFSRELDAVGVPSAAASTLMIISTDPL